MRGVLRLGFLLILMAACAAPVRPAAGTDGPAAAPASQPAARRFVVLAYNREPIYLEPSLQPENREWSALASGFLASFVPGQGAVPYLAEELPSVDKGTWTMLPDGRMETTYRLKKNATWHDGAPITADDWVFGVTARLDPNSSAHNVTVEQRLTRATAVDDHTLLLEWREPYLWAGAIHLPDFPPLARHKLEPLYQQDPAGFFEGPQWREEFIGSGPFRIASWEPGVELTFRAHDSFFLGRPTLDEVRVRLMDDANTIVANLLSGGIDAAFSTTIGFPQGQALEQAGWSGTVEYWPGLPRYLEYQGRDWGNTVPVVFDARVRRASHYAIDRKGIADIVYGGRAFVAYFWLSPSDPSYPAVDRATQKYEYDPARAQAMLAEAGWVKSADGPARNTAGQALSIPMQTTPQDAGLAEAAVVAANWKTVGITSDLQRLSPQEWRDNEIRTKFPGVAYNSRNIGLTNMVWFSSNISRPETRWSGQNRIGYVNPKLDDLWGRVLATPDPRQREGLLIDAVNVMMDDAMVVLTHITPDVMAYRPGLSGPARPGIDDASRIWNIWEWRWT